MINKWNFESSAIAGIRSELDRAMGPMAQLQKAMAPQVRVQHLGMSAGLREGLAQVADSVGLQRHGLLQKTALHSDFARSLGMGSSRHNFDQISGLTKHITSLETHQDYLLGSLSATRSGLWANHLERLTLPSIRFLASSWKYPTGLLSVLDTPQRQASFSWLGGEPDVPEIAFAALVPRTDDVLPAVYVDVDGLCTICGASLLEPDEWFSWHGSTERLDQLKIYLRCNTCFTEASNDADHWNLTPQDTHVKIECLDGDCEGDGHPAGLLRIVHDDNDDDIDG